MAWMSSMASTSGVVSAAMALPMNGTRDQIDSPGPTRASICAAAIGCTRSTAAAMLRRKTMLSSSRSSTWTQANGRGSRFAHRERSVDFP